ncbi:hypothetical protein D3C71_776970 [compost metagenome]
MAGYPPRWVTRTPSLSPAPPSRRSRRCLSCSRAEPARWAGGRASWRCCAPATTASPCMWRRPSACWPAWARTTTRCAAGATGRCLPSWGSPRCHKVLCQTNATTTAAANTRALSRTACNKACRWTITSTQRIRCRWPFATTSRKRWGWHQNSWPWALTAARRPTTPCRWPAWPGATLAWPVVHRTRTWTRALPNWPMPWSPGPSWARAPAGTTWISCVWVRATGC